MKKAFTTTFLALVLYGISCTSWAQTYPNRSIKMIVPFPPAGAADLTARIVMKALSEDLGQPVIIDNRGGADGAIAGMATINSIADGYTLLFATTTGMNAAPTMRKIPPYDPLTAFTPISLVGKFGFFLFIHADLPAKNMTEFLAYVRANPGKVNYGSGNGTSILTTAQFAQKAKLDMVHVPYKGDAPATTDLIAGRIQVLLGTPGSALQQVEEGRLRVLMTSLPKRSPLTPSTPTAEEVGIQGMTIVPWAGLFGPAGLPKEVVDRIEKAMRNVANRKDVREQLEKIAFEMQSSTPAAMAKFNQEQLETWKITADSVNLERN
ncbi:MAG: tripartite tricarboxylate transporter substrate binding protein [Alcaligenaceae bacterium]|nr:tripartite tricarboxylate transporter substrate binding protein [Alcaligenaceae bacterium]